MASRKKVVSYFDVVFPRSGILDGTKRLKELFTVHTTVDDFSELKIPQTPRTVKVNY